MDRTEILKELKGILQDFRFLLQRNSFQILKYQGEPEPHELDLVWKENWNWGQKQLTGGKKEENAPVRTAPKEQDRNFICKLCSDRLSAIRHFLIKGRKKVLVLHYTGETQTGKPAYVKTSPQRIFRTAEAEDLFDRMIQKEFGFSMREFYYQEYPACIFSQDRSSTADWKTRVENCEVQVKDTIEKEGIQGIVLLGTSAALVYGKEEASKRMGKTFEFLPGIPMIVLRSPEAILASEQKRKSLSGKNESSEFLEAKQKEIEVKEGVLSQLKIFHESVKDRI
nr:hypothetical protein [Leptospira perolatii]